MLPRKVSVQLEHIGEESDTKITNLHILMFGIVLQVQQGAPDEGFGLRTKYFELRSRQRAS